MAQIPRVILAFLPIVCLTFGHNIVIDLSLEYKGAPYKPLSVKYDRFDWRLFQNVANKQSGNLVVSPYAVKTLLYLTSLAAGGRTLDQIAEAVKDDISLSQQLELYRNQLKHSESNKYYELNLGNKLFYDIHLFPKQSFLNTIKNSYKTSADPLLFAQAEGTAERINKWASYVTKGKITHLVDPDSIRDIEALLATAVYFKGSWEILFETEYTYNLDFKVNSRKTIQLPTMTNYDVFYYCEDKHELGGVKVLRLGYKGGKYAMTFLLPNKDDGLDGMIAKITPTSIKNLQKKLELSYVQVHLPKFQFETTSKLKDTLQALGIKDLFSQAADLRELGRNVEVADVVEKAGVIVDEKGTEIYAIAEGFFGYKTSGVPSFNADHPFAFFLEDEDSGALLFAGKVVDPSKSQQ